MVLKWDKSTIDDTIKGLYKTGIRMSSFNLKKNGYSGLCSAAHTIYGNWNNALKENGIEPLFKVSKFKSAEEVAEKYKIDRLSGIAKSNIRYVKTIEKYFGSIDELEKQLGFTRFSHRDNYDYKFLSKDELDLKVFEVIANEQENVTKQLLDSVDKNIMLSIKHHYGDIMTYFGQLDIDFYKKPYVPFRWDVENTKRQLMRWIREGKDVNYTNIQFQHKGIIKASRRLFGGWKQLFEACNLNYDDYRIDSDMASKYGFEFEKIVEDLLRDFGYEFLREPSIKGCHPDFVIGNDWVDAKLSEWTISFADCGTVNKYEPHCNSLTIVFLRGNKGLVKDIGTKTKMINIHVLIKDLPVEKQSLYIDRLNEFENSMKTQEIA